MRRFAHAVFRSVIIAAPDHLSGPFRHLFTKETGFVVHEGSARAPSLFAALWPEQCIA
jgi:hypothetical protein